MSNIDLPEPKPSKLRRAVEEIKSGVKKVGQEYKAGNIPLTVPSMVKKIKNKYRKPQNIEAPESLQSVFMKEVRPMFQANLKKVQDDHTSGVPTFKSVRKAQRKSAIATTQSQIKKNPSLNKAMKKLKKQKNID